MCVTRSPDTGTVVQKIAAMPEVNGFDFSTAKSSTGHPVIQTTSGTAAQKRIELEW
jgi:hypothetical protein